MGVTTSCRLASNRLGPGRDRPGIRNGKLLTTDGPFAETKEFLGGFTLINAKDLRAGPLTSQRIRTEPRPGTPRLSFWWAGSRSTASISPVYWSINRPPARTVRPGPSRLKDVGQADVVVGGLLGDAGDRSGVLDRRGDGEDLAEQGFHLDVAELQARHLLGVIDHERGVAVAEFLDHEGRRDPLATP